MLQLLNGAKDSRMSFYMAPLNIKAQKMALLNGNRRTWECHKIKNVLNIKLSMYRYHRYIAASIILFLTSVQKS
jgi:hypothetical protein